MAFNDREVLINIKPNIDKEALLSQLQGIEKNSVTIQCDYDLNSKDLKAQIDKAISQVNKTGLEAKINLKLDTSNASKQLRAAQDMAKKSAEQIAEYFDTATKGRTQQGIRKSYFKDTQLSTNKEDLVKQLVTYRKAALDEVNKVQLDLSSPDVTMDIGKVEAYGKAMHELITILRDIDSIAGRNKITFPDFDIKTDIQGTVTQLDLLKKAFVGTDWNVQIDKIITDIEEAQKRFMELPDLFGGKIGGGSVTGIGASTEEIKQIIDILGQLNAEIKNISTAFGSIGENTELKTLLGSIQDIDNALGGMKSKVESVFDSLKTETDLTNEITALTGKIELAQTEITELKSKLATVGDGNTIELSALDGLKGKVEAVTQAVNEKTHAFEMEAATVTSSVSREGEAVEALADTIKNVAQSIETITTTVQTGLGKSGGGFNKLAEGLEKLNGVNFDIKKLKKLNELDLSGLKGINPKAISRLTSMMKQLATVGDYGFVNKINKLDFNNFKSATVPKSFDNLVKGLRKLSEIENLKDLKKLNEIDLTKLSGLKADGDAFTNLAKGLKKLAEASTDISSLSKSLKGLDLNALANIANIKDVDTSLSGMSKSFIDTQSKQINSAISKYEKLAKDATDGSDKTNLLNRIEELKQLRLLLHQDFTPAGLSKMTDIDGNMRSMVQQIHEAVEAGDALANSMSQVAQNTKNSENSFSKYKQALQKEVSLLKKKTKNGSLTTGEQYEYQQAEITRKALYDESDNKFVELQEATFKDYREDFRKNIEDTIKYANTKVFDKFKAEDYIDSSGFEKIKADLTQLKAIQDRLEKTDLINDGDVEQAHRLKESIEEAVKALELRTTSKGTFFANLSDIPNAQDRITRLKTLLEDDVFSKGGKIDFGPTNKNYSELVYSITTADGALQKWVATVDSATGKVSILNKSESEYVSAGQKFINSVKGKFLELTRYITIMDAFQKVIQFVRLGITAIREIDTAMVDLKKVTDETSASYEKFGNTAGQIARTIGATKSEIISSTADYARLGYDLDESTQLAQNTAIYKNVGDGIDIDTATEDIVSITKAYDIAAEKSMEVIDVLNEVGNSFAISSSGIGEGLRRSSSALAAGNNTFEQSVAMITAMNEVLQDPALAGTTLKMLSLRIRGAKTEIEAEGESIDGMAESTSKLREQIKALTNISGTGGFDIMTDDGDAFKSTYEIMLGISKVWKDMSDVNQAALLELIAGKNRAQGAAALLDNMATAEEALETAQSSAGSALKENEKYLESINGKISILKANFQNMWDNAVNSEVIGVFIDLGSAILKVVDNVGLLETVLGSFIAIASAKGAGGANLTVVPKLKTPAIS